MKPTPNTHFKFHFFPSFSGGAAKNSKINRNQFFLSVMDAAKIMKGKFGMTKYVLFIEILKIKVNVKTLYEKQLFV